MHQPARNCTELRANLAESIRDTLTDGNRATLEQQAAAVRDAAAKQGLVLTTERDRDIAAWVATALWSMMPQDVAETTGINSKFAAFTAWIVGQG